MTPRRLGPHGEYGLFKTGSRLAKRKLLERESGLRVCRCCDETITEDELILDHRTPYHRKCKEKRT